MTPLLNAAQCVEAGNIVILSAAKDLLLSPKSRDGA
jgi:hypothetical protein